MGLLGGAGEPVEGGGGPGGRAVAERDRPESVDLDWLAVGVAELAFVHPLVVALRVGADAPVAEVPDEEVAGEDAEIGRREREPQAAFSGAFFFRELTTRATSTPSGVNSSTYP